MNVLCQEAIRAFLGFLESEFRFEEREQGCRLYTPFLTPTNDPITIDIHQMAEDQLVLTDGGRVSDFLFLMGADLETSDSRTVLAEEITKSMQVNLDRGELRTVSNIEDVGKDLYRLLHAIQNVYDIVFTAQPGPLEKPFKQVVHEYILAQRIEPQVDYELQGQSIVHKVDFFRNGRLPRAFETLSAKTPYQAKQTAIAVAFMWIDTKKVTPSLRCYSVYDDSSDVWSSALPILTYNSDGTIAWRQREHLAELLV